MGEHLDQGQQQSHEAEADLPTSDMEEARKNAVADWLAYRAQHEAEHGLQSLEERRAKAVEEWKKLQKQKARASGAGKPGRAQDGAQRENVKGRTKDAADDPDL